jgi:hypothetical protein
MPRYFFPVRRGQVTEVDRVGVELADIGEAVKEAMRRAAEITRREASSGVALKPGVVLIEEGWRTLLELPIEDVARSSSTAAISPR